MIISAGANLAVLKLHSHLVKLLVLLSQSYLQAKYKFSC